MRIIIYLTIVFLIIFMCKGKAQHLDLEFQRYLGSDDSIHFFFQYGKRSGLVKPALVKYELRNKDTFKRIDFLKRTNIGETGFFIFKKDSLEIFYHRPQSQLRFHLGDTTIVHPVNSLHDFSQASFAYFLNDGFLLIAAHSEAPIYKFDLKTNNLIPLPLIGGNLRQQGDYVFFEVLRYSNYYSDLPNDIFRVNKNDLKNPEKVLIQVIENWYPYTTNIIYARTFPKVGDCLIEKCQGAFYNIETGKYAIQKKYIPTEKFIRIKDTTYLINIVRDNDYEFFKLEDIPPVPTFLSFDIKNDESQQPKGYIYQWNNIPLKEKTLPGTFITHELLYEAPASELRRLSREQLRILRNTFYAFQGYKFKSEDLAEYFKQFDWYQKLTMGEKSNEDIVLWPDEKERIRLIEEIDNSK